MSSLFQSLKPHNCRYAHKEGGLEGVQQFTHHMYMAADHQANVFREIMNKMKQSRPWIWRTRHHKTLWPEFKMKQLSNIREVYVFGNTKIDFECSQNKSITLWTLLVQLSLKQVSRILRRDDS